MLSYPVLLTPDDNGTILVTVPDIPDTVTFGDDEAEALVRAVDAIETALMMYVENRRDIPVPSRLKRGQKSVTLPALTEAKLTLYANMRSQGIGKAELARRLNCHMPQVDRLLDLSHASRFDQVESAFRVIGKRLVLSFEDAA